MNIEWVAEDWLYGTVPLCSSSWRLSGASSAVTCSGCDYTFDLTATATTNDCYDFSSLSYKVGVYPDYYGSDVMLYYYGGSWYIQSDIISQTASSVRYGSYYDYMAGAGYYYPYYMSRFGTINFF